MKVLVTGGAGFIGANFLLHSIPTRQECSFLNIDALTYAANPKSLEGLAAADHYAFKRVDITDASAVDEVFNTFDPDVVVHFAAESHVDRSILGPKQFVRTNIEGTFNLLEAARRGPRAQERLFHHVSTDEVYGSLGDEGFFTEETAYDPSSPYSASKAASDHLVRAYHRTYGLKVKITNCSNNYGPLQFPEKLVPLMILNACEGKALPIYGTGMNVRDWLYVEDHCRAIWAVIERGQVGETYNVGGHNEKTNIDVVDTLCERVAAAQGKPTEELKALKTFVQDRPGHDHRYAIDASKIERECGWKPIETFESGMEKTVRWYLDNADWVNDVRSGAYKDWISKNYGAR